MYDPDDPHSFAAMEELAIPIDGTQMNGHIYLAAGAGPHPTVALLHGYPGNERSLDLAQSLRRGGINVLFFHYRGTWGSGGLFSWTNAVEDAHAAVRFLRTPESRSRFRVDGDRIGLIGHSVGAWLALRVPAEDPTIRAAVALGLENLGVDARYYATDTHERESWLSYLRATVGDGRPVRAESPEALLQQLLADPDAFDLLPFASALADRPVLMIGATRDYELEVGEHQHPVAAALRAAGARTVGDIVLEADHSFSSCRLEVCRLVLSWLKSECGF